MSPNKLVDAWIKLQKLPQESEAANELMWAAEEVIMLSLSSPVDCWKVVLEILDATDDEWVLANLAAGPLENLLSMYPDESIELIEGAIKKSPKLKKMLHGVWRNSIPDAVWGRVESLRGE